MKKCRIFMFGLFVAGVSTMLTACAEDSSGNEDSDMLADTETDTAADTGSDTGSDPDTAQDSSSDTGDTETDSGPDVNPRFYGAEDAAIQYTGRIDFTNPEAPLFSSPGGYITIRFNGTGLSVSIEDEHKWDQYKAHVARNYYDVIIDGGEPIKISPEVGVSDYLVTDGLAYGEHTAVLHKRTESGIGSTVFLGVEILGELLSPPARPARKVQIIGDSIQSGSGVEAANNSAECLQDEWGVPWMNARLGYGAVTAANLEAEYHINSVSGIGLMQNYTDQYDPRTMNDVYDLLFMELEPPVDPSPTWDTSLYQPDVIIVALGTNDFSTGPEGVDYPRPAPTVQEFADAYIAFVDRLLVWYPDAEIFAVSSPMLGDNWPTPADTRRQDLIDALALVEAHYADQVHAVTVSQQQGLGCGTHPNVAQAAATADQLTDAIKTVMGW